MKIGILTFHYIPNVGASLQAYALCTYLRAKGLDVEMIDYHCDGLDKREIIFKKSGNIVYDFLRMILVRPREKKKIRNCLSFLEEQNMISNISYNRKNIQSACKVYDAIIVGSDMIWDINITDNDYTYYLDFANTSVLKFSYGSSGTEGWQEKDYEKISRLLSQFLLIGVREEASQNLLRNVMNIESFVVCDPTLLLPIDHWKKYIKKPKYKDYVLVYFPYDTVLNAAKDYASTYNKKLLVIDNSITRKKYVKIWPISIGEWLGYIESADAVFTDSYHGLIFSILFHKQVWTANIGERQKTLIKKLEIENCVICNIKEKLHEINFDQCTDNLNRYKQESYEYLNTLVSYMKEREKSELSC